MHEEPSPKPMPDTPVELADVRDRVDRLEDVVAALCDTDRLEERIADRIANKLSQQGTPKQAIPKGQPEPVKVQATPMPNVERPPVATFVEFSLPPEAPHGTPPVPKPQAPLASIFWGMLPETSLARDFWWDARTLVRLLRDPGYTATQSFRLVPLLVLFFVFLWPKLVPYLGWLVPQVSLGIIGMVLDVLLIYVAFKIVQRELRRYDEFAAKYRRQLR